MEGIKISLCEDLSFEITEGCKKTGIDLDQFLFDAVKMQLLILSELQRPNEIVEIRRNPPYIQHG